MMRTCIRCFIYLHALPLHQYQHNPSFFLLSSSSFLPHSHHLDYLRSPQSHLIMLSLIFLPFLFLFGYLFLHYARPKTTTTAPPKLPSSSSASSSSTSSSSSNDYDTNMAGNTIQQKGMLQMVFSTFDKNGDGYITKQELQESLISLGLSWEEKHVASVVENLDSDKDGRIDLVEFQALYKELGGLVGEEEEEVVGVEEELRQAFDVFDSNGDGQITVEELGLVMSSLGLGHGVVDCMSMIKKVDMDGDGKVNFQEFKAMMRSARASRDS